MEANEFNHILNLFQEGEKSIVIENKQVFEHLLRNDSNKSNLKEGVDFLCSAFNDLKVREGFLEMCSLLKELQYLVTMQICTILEKTNIKDFVKFISEFRRLPNKYLVELSDKTGNKKSTPMIGIAGVMNTFESKNSLIVRFRDNTCKIGKTYEEQWQNLIQTNTLGGSLRHAERDLHQAQWSQATNNLFGIKADEIQKKIKEDYEGHQTIKVHKLARTLTQKVNVLNACFRGKGSGDHADTDSDEYNIFSMLNKGLQGDKELKLCQVYELKFLFDRVSYRRNDNENDEPMGRYKEYDDSKLNTLGKRITERVLKLFLPKDEYEIKNEYGEIKAVAKNNKYSVAEYYLEYFDKLKKENPHYKIRTDFGSVMSEFCKNNFPAPEGLPDTEQEFRDKIDKINCEDIIKSINNMNILIDKNDFVDMLVGILYVHDEKIHGYTHSERGKTTQDVKTGILKGFRRAFALPDEFDDEGEVDPASVIFNYAPNYFKAKTNITIQGLPFAFAGYSSNDPEKKYSPLNYIQALFASALIVKKYYEDDFETRGIVASNINRLRNIFVADSDADYNLVYNEIQTQIKKNPSMKPQELFAMMICNGTVYTTKNAASKNETDDITNICDVAHDLTEYDLDDKTRKQATQLNFVELPKNAEGKERGWYINKGDGTLMLPLDIDRLYNPDKFKNNIFDDEEDSNDINQNLQNNNVFSNQDNNFNQFNGAQNYNNQNEQNDVNNNFEINNIFANPIVNNVNLTNNNHTDGNSFNLFAQNNNQEQENVPIEEKIAKQWMTQVDVQNNDDLKKTLKEYAHNEQIDNVNKASEYDFVAALIRIYKDDLRELRKALGLKEQEEDKNPNEEEKKELNDIKNQNLKEKQLLESSNNTNNKFQNNNNSLDPKRNENICNKNDNKEEDYRSNLKDDNNAYLNNNKSSNQNQDNNDLIDNSQNERNNSNNDINNPNLNNNNIFIDQHMQNNNSDQAQNLSLGGQNYNNQNQQDNMNNNSEGNNPIVGDINLANNECNDNFGFENKNSNDSDNCLNVNATNLEDNFSNPEENNGNCNDSKSNNIDTKNINESDLHNDNQDFRNNSESDNKLVGSYGNDIHSNINKKNGIDSLALYNKIKKGNHFCRDMCALKASEYNVVKNHFTFFEILEVWAYWVFVFIWIPKQSVDYTPHVNSEKKKSITYQNGSDDKEKNSQNKKILYHLYQMSENNLTDKLPRY